MTEIVHESCSEIEFKSGELYQLTFPNGYIPDEYRFYSQDIGSQTEETDVAPLRTLTDQLATLVVDNARLRREFGLARAGLQLELGRRLSDASGQLYTRMNRRLDEVQSQQDDRVEVVRRAFRTQLADSVALLRGEYEARLRLRNQREKTFESSESEKFKKKIAELASKLRKSETKVKELEVHIAEMQENEEIEQLTLIMDDDSEEADKREEIVEEEEMEEADDGDKQSRENTLIEELNSKNKKNENELVEKKSLIENLKEKIQKLETSEQKSKETIEKLTSSFEELNKKSKLVTDDIEKIKIEKYLLEEKCSKIEQDFPDTNQGLNLTINKANIPKTEKATSPQFETPDPKPEMIRFSVLKHMKDYPDQSKDVEQLKKKLEQFQDHERNIASEVLEIRKNMEKESLLNFDQIQTLQSVISKLRNELFQRTTLQNNFKSLHSASVLYAKNNAPIGIVPNQLIEKDKLSTNRSQKSIQKFESAFPLSDTDSKLMKNFIELNS